MKNTNSNSTRYHSSNHEASIAKALGGKVVSGSGSGHFNKGDVVVEDASLLVEAKCSMKEKDSVSVRKEWLDKNKDESFSVRKENQAICINFGPDSSNYYIINERLMKFLVEKLTDFYQD